MAGNIADINAVHVEGSGACRGEVPMNIWTLLIAVALNGECREASTAITHIKGGKPTDSISLVFENLHGSIPGVDGLNAGNLRATIGLRLVFGERPTVEVSRNQNGILVFVHV